MRNQAGDKVQCLCSIIIYLAKCSFAKSLAVIDKGAEFAKQPPPPKSSTCDGAFSAAASSTDSLGFAATRASPSFAAAPSPLFCSPMCQSRYLLAASDSCSAFTYFFSRGVGRRLLMFFFAPAL